jgi:hypothetical protein
MNEEKVMPEYKALDFDGTERRANYRTVAYREDVLHVLDHKDAAAIIYEIIYWWQTSVRKREVLKEIERRKKSGATPLTEEEAEDMMWAYISYNEFVRESGGAISYNTVIRTLDYLVNIAQVVKQRENHNPRFGDYEYRIDKDAIKEKLKALPVSPVFAPKVPKKKGSKGSDSTQVGTSGNECTRMGIHAHGSTQMGTGYTQMGRATTQMGTEVYPNGGTSHNYSHNYNSSNSHNGDISSASELAAATSDASASSPAPSSSDVIISGHDYTAPHLDVNCASWRAGNQGRTCQDYQAAINAARLVPVRTITFAGMSPALPPANTLENTPYVPNLAYSQPASKALAEGETHVLAAARGLSRDAISDGVALAEEAAEEGGEIDGIMANPTNLADPAAGGNSAGRSGIGNGADQPATAGHSQGVASATLSGGDRHDTRAKGDGSRGVGKTVPGGERGYMQAALVAPNEQVSAKVEKPAQEALIERPAVPEMPLQTARWCAETALLVSEALRAKYYTPSQRANQTNAARRMFRDFPAITRAAFEEIFADWARWWRDHDKGYFTLADLLARGQNREVRLQTALDRLEARASAPKTIAATPIVQQSPQAAGAATSQQTIELLRAQARHYAGGIPA